MVSATFRLFKEQVMVKRKRKCDDDSVQKKFVVHKGSVLAGNWRARGGSRRYKY